MCLSIYQHEDCKPYLGDTLEVWNDKDMYYIDTFNHTKEIEEIVKENK